MANRRVRVVRNVKLNGKPTFVAPVTTPKGAVSSEMVLYKGQRLTVRSDAGIWYIRWEEGHRPKWQRCQSLLVAVSDDPQHALGDGQRGPAR